MNLLEPDPSPLGDMDPEAFRAAGHSLIEWIARYLSSDGEYPVLARVSPGDIRAALPAQAPENPESMAAILADFERILVPGLTHWNQPGFLAYFAISASGPGILGELLTAALNQQAMLWRTSPSATELEEVVLGWLRQLLHLPPAFEGVTFDGGSTSTLHALAAARAAAVPEVRGRGLAARPDLPPLRVYASEHAHSSVDKAIILLGLGHDALRKIPADRDHRMRVDALRTAVDEDRAAGRLPIAVVASVGTTSAASIDPVPAIADLCEAERIWLHVDAAYAGPAAMVPGFEWIFDGVPRADSVLVNPHKWLFTPIDCSAFFCRRLDVLRAGLALTPDYLETSEGAGVRNLMDVGIPLGRRFRALKLWMVLRAFGAEGIRARLAEHIRLAKTFADWIDNDPDFERAAPVPLSVVCFRARPRPTEDAEALNTALMDRVNATGDIYLSHTRLEGRLVLRIAIGQIRTTETHIARAWQLLREALANLRR